MEFRENMTYRFRSLCKDSIIGLIHSSKAGHIGKVDVNLDNLINAGSRSFENGREVVQSLSLQKSVTRRYCPQKYLLVTKNDDSASLQVKSSESMSMGHWNLLHEHRRYLQQSSWSLDPFQYYQSSIPFPGF